MDKLYKALKDTGIEVYYSYAVGNVQPPYICYMEYAEKYLKANNKIADTVIKVQVDYYTITPLDSNTYIIKDALENAGVPFEYTLVYDSENEVYHHVFDCEVFM